MQFALTQDLVHSLKTPFLQQKILLRQQHIGRLAGLVPPWRIGRTRRHPREHPSTGTRHAPRECNRRGRLSGTEPPSSALEKKDVDSTDGTSISDSNSLDPAISATRSRPTSYHCTVRRQPPLRAATTVP
jgi:hypothetical protein